MRGMMESSICITCGTQYPPSTTAPSHCPICEDERQYVNPAGQQWTSLGKMQGSYHNAFVDVAEGITGIHTEPHFAIGQQAHLIRTGAGNLLWDCVSLIDAATVERVKSLGGLAAIAISHPHFYSSMVEWSRAFDAPIYLHAENQPWVMRPDDAVQYWQGETFTALPGLTLVRCGGHFPGSCVLHWAGGEAGGGALFTGDTITVVRDRRYVSFMYSYPNLVPLSPSAVMRIVAAVEPYAFDRIYGGWKDDIVTQDGKEAVRRSAE